MKPGRQQLTGYVLRDYDDAIARLREARLAKRITQVEVAARIGHTVHVDISRWLSGARTATGPSLFDLAYALGYDLALIPREDT